MIDIHNLAEIVRPIRPAIRAVLTWLAGRWLSARQHARDRSEEVAPVKAGRKALWLPIDITAPRLRSAAQDQFEQPVAGAYVPPAVRLNYYGRPRPPNAGIVPPEFEKGRKPKFGFSEPMAAPPSITVCYAIMLPSVGDQQNFV